MADDMSEEHVAAAQRLFAEGRGVDAVLERLREPGFGTLLLIKMLREVTGLGLQDAVRCIEPPSTARLDRLTRARVELLAQARRTGGINSSWTSLYCSAVFDDAPWLTMVPGRRAEGGGLGSVHYWTLPEPPEGESLEGYGSISGPGVDFAELVADLRAARATLPFWRENAEIVHDAPDRLTCRFCVEAKAAVSKHAFIGPG